MRVLPAFRERASQGRTAGGGGGAAGSRTAGADWKVQPNFEDFTFENSLQSSIASSYVGDSLCRASQPQGAAVRSMLFPLTPLGITSFWSGDVKATAISIFRHQVEALRLCGLVYEVYLKT